MLLKNFALLLLLSQSFLASPTPNGLKPTQITQEQLKQQAQAETINLLNALFRAQIAYFKGVQENLAPSSKRAQDIDLYVSRLTEAIAEQELDKKDAMWLNIFEQFSKSPLLLNKQDETGLSNDEYQAVLTDKKLQEITKSFLNDVTTYFWKVAQISSKAVENSVDEYMQREAGKHL